MVRIDVGTTNNIQIIFCHSREQAVMITEKQRPYSDKRPFDLYSFDTMFQGAFTLNAADSLCDSAKSRFK